MSIVEQEQEDETASCPLQAWPGGEGGEVPLQGWAGRGPWVYSFCFSFTVSSLRPYWSPQPGVLAVCPMVTGTLSATVLRVRATVQILVVNIFLNPHSAH